MTRTTLRKTAFAAVLCLAVAQAAAAGAASVGVLPPPRPAGLGSGVDIETTGALGPASRPAGAPALLHPAAGEAPPRLDNRALVEKANVALNAVTSMTADFTQINGDGRRIAGTLYLQRPGKVRFEYDKPSTLEVVSDGSTVLVRDRKLNTSDPYPIGQTPLKFLLSSRIDLTRESTVTSVAGDDKGVRIAIEDRSTLGGTSRITLSFDPAVTGLNGWKVVDPQGYTTTVVLSDIEKNRTIDPRIFMLNYMRPVE